MRISSICTSARSMLVVQRVDRRDYRRAPGDIVSQLFVLGRLQLGFLILGEQPFGLSQPALRQVLGSFSLPLLDGIVVEQLGNEERTLEVRLRMRMTEIMAARTNVA